MHTGPPSRSVHGRLAPGALCRDAATESSLLDGRFSLSALARLAANPRVLHYAVPAACARRAWPRPSKPLHGALQEVEQLPAGSRENLLACVPFSFFFLFLMATKTL